MQNQSHIINDYVSVVYNQEVGGTTADLQIAASEIQTVVSLIE